MFWFYTSDKSGWDSGDLKWYFFCPREKKYARGNRIQRATAGGYWKTTGKDRSVLCSGAVVGWIKTLIFHTGRAPHGDRTDWVMHEYRLEDQGLADRGVPLVSHSLPLSIIFSFTSSSLFLYNGIFVPCKMELKIICLCSVIEQPSGIYFVYQKLD